MEAMLVQVAWGLMGAALVLLVVVDVLWTTLYLQGAGPLTAPVSQWLWSLTLGYHRRHSAHHWLARIGFVITLITLLLWVSLTWVGWTLLFQMTPQAVVDAQHSQPADVWARAYYAGFTLITLGVGDYRAGSAVWQQLTVVCATNGFFLVTLAITYLLPLVAAVVQKRQLAAYIAALGGSPTSIIQNAWNGENVQHLTAHLQSLAPQIITLGQRYLAYPILYCFHSREQSTALAPNIVALAEALRLIEHALPETARPDPLTLRVLNQSIQVMLDTLDAIVLPKVDGAPPPVDLQPLLAQQIPLNQAAYQRALAADTACRRLLGALLHHAGWGWPEVVQPRR